MKISEVDILVVPGLGDSGPDHWQSRWEAKLPHARRVVQADWDRPAMKDWADRVVAEVVTCTRPVVLVAHSCGVNAVVSAASRLTGKIVGAWLVAAPDVDDESAEHAIRVFAPTPMRRLPFHAWQVASRDDPYCRYERAEAMAAAWGTRLVDAGEAGHLNAESGHGPWPEGLVAFAHFMKAI